jgi:phenylpropionate dioxygenase-like ring-hydroxylating dioxygenase large terminal subunit
MSWQSIVWPSKLNHVPKQVFVHPELFEEELQRIFYGDEWIPIAHEGEVPNKGDFKTCKIGRVPLLVTRGADDKVRVFLNSCSHRGNQVETAPSGNRKTFECPYHRWVFNTQGELIGCPARPGDFPDEWSRDKYPLAQPRVEIVHGLIMVTLGKNPPPIDDYLEGLKERMAEVMGGDGRLRLLGYQRVIYKANWKLYTDNDAYHAPLLHAAFRLLNWQGGQGSQVANARGHRAFVSQLSLPRGATFLKDPSLIEYKGQDLSKGSMAVRLFPIAAMVKHMDSISIRFGNPISTDETEVYYAYFHRVDDSEEMIRHRVRQSSNLLGPCGMVSMEDAATFHRLHIGSNTPGDAIFQKGVKSEYAVPEVFGQNDETGNIPAWLHYREIMGFAKEPA